MWKIQNQIIMSKHQQIKLIGHVEVKYFLFILSIFGEGGGGVITRPVSV
jgi:hypothetical protein